jgi:hypothetical protein
MTPVSSVNRLAAAAALALLSISCGDVVRSGKSPMFLVIDSLQGRRGGGSDTTLGNPLQSDVLTLVTSPAPCTIERPCPTVFNDLGQVALRIVPKDIGTSAAPTEPSTNNEVTIMRFHVSYRRADGRNTPGLDVPYAWDGAATGTVSIGGQATMSFELVRRSAKQEAPLRDLVDSPTVLTTTAEVTFYGQDRVGNEISVAGSIQVDFGNFRD